MAVAEAAQPDLDERPERRPEERTRRQRMVAPAVVAGTVGLTTIALHFRDPHTEGSWGICPTAALGFWCPGCGGLRAVNDLTNVQIADAASSNLLFVASIPLILYVFGRWTLARWTGRPWRIASTRLNVIAGAALVVMLVFSLVRNLPMGTWLAP